MTSQLVVTSSKKGFTHRAVAGKKGYLSNKKASSVGSLSSATILTMGSLRPTNLNRLYAMTFKESVFLASVRITKMVWQNAQLVLLKTWRVLCSCTYGFIGLMNLTQPYGLSHWTTRSGSITIRHKLIVVVCVQMNFSQVLRTTAHFYEGLVSLAVLYMYWRPHFKMERKFQNGNLEHDLACSLVSLQNTPHWYLLC